MASVVLGIFFSAGILLHESGHYFAAKLFGWGTHFSYSRVSIVEGTTTPMSRFLFKAAGPMVDVVLVVVGVIGLSRSRARTPDISPGIEYWIATACVLASLRWLKAPFQLGSDEAEMSVQIGLPYYVIPCVMAIPTVCVIGFLLCKHYQQQTIPPLVVGFLAGSASLLLWLRVIGPQVLPKF